jgi:hypothetical protein
MVKDATLKQGMRHSSKKYNRVYLERISGYIFDVQEVCQTDRGKDRRLGI